MSYSWQQHSHDELTALNEKDRDEWIEANRESLRGFRCSDCGARGGTVDDHPARFDRCKSAHVFELHCLGCDARNIYVLAVPWGDHEIDLSDRKPLRMSA